jgi:GNAT superfamily N-acetyltransferase
MSASLPGVLADLSPDALVAAVKDNLNGFNRHLRHAPATEWYDEAGLYVWRTPIPHEYYNGVVCDGPPGPGAGEAARAAVEFFRAGAVPAFVWWLGSRVGPSEWAPHLPPGSFALEAKIPGMAAELASLRDDPRLAPVEIRRVLDPEALRVWTRTFARGFDVSEEWGNGMLAVYRGLLAPDAPIRYYLAYRAGRPVATSTMFLGAGVAGIYDVATIPSARRQGLGFAVTWAPLLEARAEGYRAGILHASSLGRPVYERMGFRTVCTMEYFLWRAAPPGPSLGP